MLLNDKTGEIVNQEIGTCKRKLLVKIAEKFPEVVEKYNEVLEQQKKDAEAKR